MADFHQNINLNPLPNGLANPIVNGAPLVSIDVGFQAKSVIIDNYSPYYLYIKDADSYVPPYFATAIRSLVRSTDYGYVQFATPFAGSQSPTDPSFFVHLVWLDVDLGYAGGSSLIGVSATSSGGGPPASQACCDEEIALLQQILAALQPLPTLANTGSRSNANNAVMNSAPTVGNLACVVTMIGAGASAVSTSPGSGWIAATPEVIVHDTHHLGDPYEHARAWYKFLVSGDISGSTILFSSGWSVAGETAMFAWEINGLGTSVAVTDNTNQGDTPGPATAGSIVSAGFTIAGFWQLATVLAGGNVPGFTEDTSGAGGWDAGGSGPRGWVGHVINGGSINPTLTAGIATNWGGLTVNFRRT